MDLVSYVVVLFLIFSRLSGIFLLTPVFGNKVIPSPLKIGFTFFLTFITSPLITDNFTLLIDNTFIFFYYLISEFIIGLMFGFIFQLVLSSIYLAGQIVDYNIGFSIVNVMSPEDESEIPITANLYYTIAIFVFLVTNSHHQLVKSILHSFNLLPLGFSAGKLIMLNNIIDILRTSFILGFKMALPIIITIFITNVLLGILSRAIPQMNVFVVGMPLKIIIGLITIYIVLPLYIGIFKNIFSIIFDYISSFINSAL